MGETTSKETEKMSIFSVFSPVRICTYFCAPKETGKRNLQFVAPIFEQQHKGDKRNIVLHPCLHRVFQQTIRQRRT